MGPIGVPELLILAFFSPFIAVAVLVLLQRRSKS
jgi:hypothetical protein